MAVVHNLTPFASSLQPHVDTHGMHCQLLVVKGVWSMRTQRLTSAPSALSVVRTTPARLRMGELALHKLQREILEERLDEEIEWLACDTLPAKPLFDFLVVGYAHASQPCTRFSAAVHFRQERVALELHAPRYWQSTIFAGGGGLPGAYQGQVSRVPLHPAFSYGGIPQGRQISDNPSGMGHPDSGKQLSSIALPWIEHPHHRLKTLLLGAKPSAFGPWGSDAQHRSIHAGTYDETWKRERSPLLPSDFDERYYNQADQRLQWSEPPRPGEAIELHNLSPHGPQRIIWPQLRLVADVGGTTELTLQPDTCIVSTEEDVFAIVWRSTIAAGVSPRLRVS